MCDTCAFKQRHLGYHALTHRNGLAVEYQVQEQPVGEYNILYIETGGQAHYLIDDHSIRVT